MRKLVFMMLALTVLMTAPTLAAVALDTGTMQAVSGGCTTCSQQQYSCGSRPCARDGVTNTCSTCQGGMLYHYYCIPTRSSKTCYTVVKQGGCGSWIWDGFCRNPIFGPPRCSGKAGTPDDSHPCDLMLTKGSKC